MESRGVLTKPAAIALGVIVLFGGAVSLGWAARAVAAELGGAQHSTGAWATTVQVEALAVEVRSYREEVRTALSRLREVELAQARQQGAATASGGH